MSERVLLYGATGYTAGLIIAKATELGLRPILAGRNSERLSSIAAAWGLPSRVFDLRDARAVSRGIAGIEVVLNAAGPFAATAEPLIRACLTSGSHYLDICGEVRALEAAARLHRSALERKLMILPGVGFDVVPSDCLAAYVVRRLPTARSLDIAVSGLQLLSPGSAKAIAAELSHAPLQRQGGALAAVPSAAFEREFDFGSGSRTCVAVSWGDLVSAYYSTGIRDIRTYFDVPPAIAALMRVGRTFQWLQQVPWLSPALLAALAGSFPGPSAEVRAAHHACVFVKAEDRAGRRVCARLHTPEAYTFTAEAAVYGLNRVLAGDSEPGYQTPARLWGPDFVLRFAGVTRVDVAEQETARASA